ncbi:MAG TPA: c-type cytochrome domain-containing protein, partial [Pirellulales bacterium]|nr:c-type cytochrome domain-containing protein [Pirellulales bacterium]
MTPASFLWAEEAASTQPAPIAIAELERTTPVSFADEILPILRKNCLACHNAAEAESELVLETPEAIRKGGAEGPVVVPGKGAESRLVQLAAARQQPAMPPAGNKVGATALSSEELGLLKLWIDQGAAGGGPAIARVVPRRSLPSGLQPIFAAAITSDDQFVAVNRGARLFAYHLPGMRLAGELADPALAGEPGKHAAHEDLIRSLAFDRGGDLLASGGFRTVKLWRRPRSVLEREIAVGQPAQVIAVSADGGWLAVGLSNGAIELRGLGEGQPVKMLAGHAGAVTGLAFSADSARLYSASSDKTLRAWTATDGAPLGKLAVPAEVRALASIADGLQLAAGDADNAIRIWNSASIVENAADQPPLQPVRELKGHSQPVTALAAAAGERLLSGGADGRMKLWNTATGEMLRDFDHGGPVVAVAVRPDGRRFASAGANGIARLWNPDDGAMVAEIKGDPRAAQALAHGDAAVNYARACIEYRKEEHREAEETLKRETAIVEGAHKAKEQADKTLAEKTEKSTKAVEARTAAEATASAMAAVLQTAADKKSAAQAALDEADKAVKQATAAFDAARAAAEKDKENKDLAAARESAEKALADSRAKKQAAEAALKPAVDEFREAERKNQEAKRAANEAANKAKGP